MSDTLKYEQGTEVLKDVHQNVSLLAVNSHPCKLCMGECSFGLLLVSLHSNKKHTHI